MKTSLLAACAFAALLLSGCVTDAPRTSLRPGPYDPDARIRDAETDSYPGGMVVVPYGMYGGYGYPGMYGGFGYGYYGGFGYGAPWYGYGMRGPIIIEQPRRHHRPRPNMERPPSRPPGSGIPRPPRPATQPPRPFRDLFPGARP